MQKLDSIASQVFLAMLQYELHSEDFIWYRDGLELLEQIIGENVNEPKSATTESEAAVS